MKRSGFLKMLGALLVAPKLIESKANTYDGKVEYMSYSDFVKKYPLTPEQAFDFNKPTKDIFAGIDPVSPDGVLNIFNKSGNIIYRKV